MTPPALALRRATALLPGLGLCVLVGLAAGALQQLERALLGRAWLEPLVLAILIGTALRAAWSPGPRFRAGVAFTAKTVLEVSIVLLGAGFSFAAATAAGPALPIAVAAVVGASLAAGYGVGRLLGLPHRLAVLIACGNSICGNSAIAAAAPAIGADEEEVAASIAFTAVLGVATVLLLPAVGALAHLGPRPYGVLAGLTVYAVPQVLPAAAPEGAVAIHAGLLVKLMRVLMLGPVVLLLARTAGAARRPARPRPGGAGAVPWFILGFLGLMACRSAAILPAAAAAGCERLAGLLTVAAMAALGLGADVRALARASLRATGAATLSLALIGVLALLVIHLLRLG